MPTKPTNREDKRNQRRRKRPKTKTRRMGRYRTNRIQHANKKWECRFGDCQREMDSEKATFNHRNGQRPENNLERNKQTTTCPYCSKTYSATDKLLMHLKLLPQKGTRNMENARSSRLKTPRRKDESRHFSK